MFTALQVWQLIVTFVIIGLSVIGFIGYKINGGK